MIKMIRIDSVSGVKSAIVEGNPFGDEVVKFTFSDGQSSYASAGAFPSREIMIKDATKQGGYINQLLEQARGDYEYDDVVVEAESMNNWTPVWVDNTLRAV